MSAHSRSLRRWITLLGGSLCLLVLVMATIIWRDGKNWNQTQSTRIEADSLVIQRAGFDNMQLSKIQGQWEFELPCKLSVNEPRLLPLLNALTPGAFQYTSSEVDLEAAGLLSPEAIITINDVEHRIGITDLGGERRYLQRGDSVELVPEWVLSLVNGGMSALAQLEIFTEPMSSLTVINDTAKDREITLPDELAVWQNLSAQQITSWPLPDMELTLDYQLQAVFANGQARAYSVYQNNSLAAIVPKEALCAYILSADALP
ncbi:MAG: hypothetical protein AB8B97_17980 [Granulosicoccus sp.]